MSSLTLSWAELKEHGRTHCELSPDHQREAEWAFSELERIFGAAFLDKHHPLFWFFTDRSGWRCEWAIWFAKLVKSLEGHADFTRLVCDLQNPSRYGERMTILNVVEVLTNIGFSFALDTTIQINGNPKEPDLRVELGSNPPFYIEVASLHTSRREREADRVFHEITAALLPFSFQLDHCGWLERTLTRPHLQEVIQTIQRTAAKAVAGMGFEAIEIPGVMQLALAAKSETGKLNQWAEARGIKINQFCGANVNVSEIERISNKLRGEQEQLPPDRSNVVVICSQLFEMPPTSQMQFEQLVHRLEEEVFKFSHVGYLALVLNWIGNNPNQVLRYGDHLCVNRARFYFLCDSTLLIKNRFAAKPMPALVEQKFREGFIASVQPRTSFDDSKMKKNKDV